MIRQHRSPLNPEFTKISRSEKLRLTSPKISSIGTTKPYSDMYNHNYFTDLEQEQLNFLYNLQTFTYSGNKLNPDVPERKAWMVHYNRPLPLVGQKVSPTHMLYDEQTNTDKVNDTVKKTRQQIHNMNR